MDCKPVADEDLDILDMNKTMQADVKLTGKRPRDAFSETVTLIPKRFKSSSSQVSVRFPAYNKIQRQLAHTQTATHIPVPDPCDIQDELRTTLPGKSIPSQDDPNYLERFLLYFGQNGKLLLFAPDKSCGRCTAWSCLRVPPPVDKSVLFGKLLAFSA